MKTTIAFPGGSEPRQNQQIPQLRNNGNGSTYGSRELPRETLAVCAREVEMPVVNKKHILAVAKARGRNGEQDIREHSARQFGYENAELEGQCQRLETVLETEKRGAERHCREFSAKLEQTPPTVIHPGADQPLTLFSKAMILFLLLVSFGGLAMGINTNATTLMATGIPAFENPARAYFYSAVPILLAAIIKVIGLLMENSIRRRVYIVAVCLIGMALGILWAASFAKTFPGLTQNVADIVQSLSAADASHSSQPGSGWMIFISILAESFLAAGCWLTIQIICDRHQKTVIEPNPVYESFQTELDAWGKRRNECERLAGQLAGKLNAITDARKHFVEDCVGHFHAALKLASDNDGLKDFLKD